MTRYRFRWLIWVALMVFTCWQTIACRPVPNSGVQAPPTNCRLVEHAVGKTCVPNTIQRLVTLDTTSFEQAIALGFQPVGAPLSERVPSYLDDRIVGVENIGIGGRTNLERVLALKPDLILGLDSNQDIYAQASQIAPTILIQFDHSGEWKAVFQRFSIALNRQAIAQQMMHHYSRRLQELQNSLKTKTPSIQDLFSPPKVSVVRIYPDTINLYFRESFCGTILQDAGLARPKTQDFSASEAKQRFNNEIQASISLEEIEQADGDVMFIWTAEDSAASDKSVQEKLVKLQLTSLWQRLNVIKMDRVYFVPSYWIGSGPLAADAVIDDLFKYLAP